MPAPPAAEACYAAGMQTGDQQFALFDTPVGRCAIAWGPRGVTGIQLPEADEPATRARVGARFPRAREAAAPPPVARRAARAIGALLRGQALDDGADIGAVTLDMDGVPPFHRRVYQVTRTIPPGATLSYGDVAARAGSPGGARAVGQALARNPFAILVPCHRVLAAGGRIGGFTAAGGVTTKVRLLALEGSSGGAAPVMPEKPRAPGAGSGLTYDPAAAVRHLRAVDPALGRLIGAVGPFALRRQPRADLFAALAQAIVYQQLSGKAAATILGRVRALFGRDDAGPTAEQILGASDDRLRGAGLSRGKLAALRDLAGKARAGELPTLAEATRMDDAALIDRLTRVRGVGRWTVEMLLIFRLGRPDVLPADDLGIRKGFARAFRKRQPPSREELERRGRRWSPYRTVASWYLWRANDLEA